MPDRVLPRLNILLFPFSDGGASFLKGLSENGLDGKGFIYTMIKLWLRTSILLFYAENPENKNK